LAAKNTCRVIALSPDGQYVAVGENHRASVWAASGKKLRDLPCADGRASLLAFSGEGRFLATAGERSPVRVWDWAAGKRARSFERKGPARCLALDRTGATLLVGCRDRVFVWDVETGKQLAVTSAGDDALE